VQLSWRLPPRALRPALLLALLAVPALLALPGLWRRNPEGNYRRAAAPEVLARWRRDHETKRPLVPSPPEPVASERAAVDFSGTYRFGRYDYDLVIVQRGDRVTFRSGGVDRQDIGGAFETVGSGEVRDGKIRARWWCFDLSRNYANNGGAEIWFHDGDRSRLRARYYHDADETIEEGYGVRAGRYEGERLHYRIRVPQPARTLTQPLLLRGTVRGDGGETLADAVVMLRHEEESAVRTDADGGWKLPVRALPAVLMVAAAAPGYRTQVRALLQQEVRELSFVLPAASYGDDARYAFVDPTAKRGEEIWNCGNCHRNSYEEWRTSRHALSARSEVTRAVYARDFLPALRSGEAEGDEGLCSACHAPQAALDGAVARLDEVNGVARSGNHCDFCHKVHHVEEIEAPGVRGSLALGRPAPDDASVPGRIKRVYGPLADSDYLFMGPVYSPFHTTSTLCAGCHQHTTSGGVAALDTYDEWRAWARGRASAETCQDCHMPTGLSMEGDALARRICVNALRRPTEQIHDHSFLGRSLASGSVDLTAEGSVGQGGLEVRTRVTARHAGHRVPTGSGDKHLLLVVLASDGEENPLPLELGPRVPAHAGGEGDPLALSPEARRRRRERGDLAGFAGREFAQVLADRGGRTHVPFWRAVSVVRDTRLQPGRPVEVRHRFGAPSSGPALVRVELWHRLRFKRGDVAADVTGEGARPLDSLLAVQTLEVN
jgi:hypothetical protein